MKTWSVVHMSSVHHFFSPGYRIQWNNGWKCFSMYIAFSWHLVQVKTKTGFQLWLEYLFGWIDKFLKTLWGESWKENIATEMHRCKPHIFISSWKGAKSVRILAYGLSFCAWNSGVGLEMLTQRVHGQKDALLWDFFSLWSHKSHFLELWKGTALYHWRKSPASKLSLWVDIWIGYLLKSFSPSHSFIFGSQGWIV